MVLAAELRNGQILRDGVKDRMGERAFSGVSALAFAASVTVTILWCGSMPSMGMAMPGGWTMSMAWMRMPGQTWPTAAASFLGMWLVMMVAMMLPSLVPMLRRYRNAVDRRGETRLGWLTTVVGAGYFFVWAVFGMATFQCRHQRRYLRTRSKLGKHAPFRNMNRFAFRATRRFSRRAARVKWSTSPCA